MSKIWTAKKIVSHFSICLIFRLLKIVIILFLKDKLGFFFFELLETILHLVLLDWHGDIVLLFSYFVLFLCEKFFFTWCYIPLKFYISLKQHAIYWLHLYFIFNLKVKKLRKKSLAKRMPDKIIPWRLKLKNRINLYFIN